MGAASSAGESEAARLRELALLFLRLGATAFGGPAAHMALMKREVVDERKWLTPAQLLDLIAATNLIPGPSSTELAIHIGQERAGQRGAVVAGACFILPATLVTLAVAWLYVEYGHLPRAEAALYGMKPVIVAIVAHALFSLARVAVKSAGLVAIGLAAVLTCALGVPELAVLGGAAAIAAASRSSPGKAGAPAVVAGLPALVATAAPSVTTGGLFLVFLKIGSVLFGSGYVLVAFLRADLVEARGWLTEAQLLDAVAAGQITPGPVFTTATFIGYVLDGLPGASAATVGIFLPAFVFVAASGWLLPRLRRSKTFGAALDGINVASIALMLVVTFDLARACLIDPFAIALALGAFAVLVRTKVNPMWPVAGGAAGGVVLRALGWV